MTKLPIYTVRRFPSATGYVWFQVMGPSGRVYESQRYDDAQAEADRRNQQHQH